MKKAYFTTNTDEPIGIIITRGTQTQPRPKFSAYVWGTAPDVTVKTPAKAA